MHPTMESLIGTYGSTSQVPTLLLVADVADEPIIRRLRVDFRRRGFVVRVGHPGVLQSTDPRRLHRGMATVVLVPYSVENRKHGDKTLAHIDQVSRTGHPPIVVASAGDDRIEQVLHPPEAIIRYGAGRDYDGIVEDLLLALLGPLPPWLDMRASPSQLAAPTGVSWWADDLIVADEHFGHVVLLSAGEAHPVVVGLREPHHVHLDRHKVLIADKGSNRIVLGDLDAGAVGNIRSIAGDGRGFICPNGVHQADGCLAVADTDNHRVLITEADLWASRKRPEWRVLEARGGLRHPCGTCVQDDIVWVADTFHHRVIAFDREGNQLRELPGYGWEPGRFAYPTSIVTWHDLIFVADSEARRVQVFSIEKDGPNLVPLEGPGIGEGELGKPWIANPFGLSINHNGRLAVSDRLRRCIWLIDIPALRPGWTGR